MKKLLLTFVFATICILTMQAQVIKTVDVTNARLSDQLTPTEQSTVTDLTITAGEITSEDIIFMKKNMPALASLDMKTASTTNNVVVGFRDFVFKKVVLPDSTQSLGEVAFFCCYNLTSLTIPEGVKSLGNQSISSCISLESIVLPNSITTLLGSTVDNCTKLTSVNIPKGVTFLVNGFAIRCTALKSITIPEGITGIGAGAFAFSGLTSVNLPSTLIDLDSNIFLGCPALTSVTFSPNSQLTAINSACFKDCPLITTITIPSQVKTIGYEAFRGCTGLTSITNEALVPQTLTEEVFTGVNVANIKLNVPAGKVNAYKTDPIWGSLDVQGTDPTAISNNEASTIKLLVANGVMQVSNVDAMASVEVYSATGTKIASAMNTECATFKNLPQGIVMVKVIAQGGTNQVLKAMIR